MKFNHTQHNCLIIMTGQLISFKHPFQIHKNSKCTFQNEHGMLFKNAQFSETWTIVFLTQSRQSSID